jgi:two-component system, OmpR family, sensor histidine kinase MprB
VKVRSTSIAARAAWAAFASAGFAAAIAAVAASAFAEILVLRQTDEHLIDAATELARELRTAHDAPAIENVVRDEQQEATSTGIRFAIYGPSARPLAGDTNVPLVERPCATNGDLRICRVSAPGGTDVVAATLRKTAHTLLGLAALVAAALAGCVAWAIARVLSRRAVGPLVRLQACIASMPFEGATRAAPPLESLGSDEGVAEVDALRGALRSLLGRMHDAIERSSHFAANAAHELRTPLTALRAELELMAEAEPIETGGRAGDSSAPLALSLRVALRKVAQLQSLTERLLFLAMPDGSGEDAFEVVSMRDVVDEAIAALAPEDASRVAIADEADLFVRGDPAALGIALSNGLANALKFGAHVSLETFVHDDLAVVAIEDDGPGVPEDERARMFEPFVRGAGSNRVQGHGLGLALVAHVSKRHRGRACLTAARNGPRGARLEIRLPRAAEAPEE